MKNITIERENEIYDIVDAGSALFMLGDCITFNLNQADQNPLEIEFEIEGIDGSEGEIIMKANGRRLTFTAKVPKEGEYFGLKMFENVGLFNGRELYVKFRMNLVGSNTDYVLFYTWMLKK